MTYRLPNGTIASFSTAFSEKITLKEISNADPVIAVVDGDKKMAVDDVWYAQRTGWHGLRNRVGVIGPLLNGNKVTLRGIDSTNTQIFKKGYDTTTTARVVTAWESFPESTEISISGGEQQYYKYRTISAQIPTNKSPLVIHFETIYDHGGPWYEAVQKIDRRREIVVLRIKYEDGNAMYLSGYLSSTRFCVHSEPTIIEA